MGDKEIYSPMDKTDKGVLHSIKLSCNQLFGELTLHSSVIAPSSSSISLMRIASGCAH